MEKGKREKLRKEFREKSLPQFCGDIQHAIGIVQNACEYFDDSSLLGEALVQIAMIKYLAKEFEDEIESKYIATEEPVG